MSDSCTAAADEERAGDAVAALLRGRGARGWVRDGAAERAALGALAQGLADDPERLLQRLAEVARALCGASAVVIAVRDAGEDGDEICWRAVAGGLAGQEGKRWPIRACPCGVCVLQDAPVLFAQPQQAFDSVRATGATVAEVLGVPWRVRGQATGALMAMLGREGEQFDAHDLALLGELAGFAAAAHQSRGALADPIDREETDARPAGSEERFRALVEGFGQAVWETDADGRRLVASPSWSAYTGQREPASLGKGWLDAVHPEDREQVEREWQAALAMRRSINMELRVHVAMGGWRWTNVRAAPLFRPDGSLRKWFGVNIDIDERRRTQAALADSERRYRMLFEAMDEGFLLAAVESGEDGRVTGLRYLEANPAAVRMTGIHYVAPGQLRVRPEHEPCWLDACAEVARSGIGTRSQCYAEALQRWFDFFVNRVGGDGTRVAILFHDITERKRAEDALRDADRRKDEFLATLAHELRNPLAPISNAVQLMRRPDGRRQSDRVVEMIGRQVRQIVRLVDDLMEVSRITRGKVELRLERVPLAEIVHSAVETSQPAIERAGHQLAVALPEEPLMMLADRLRLTQVFANLLNNAAKYTDPGGRIWVDVWREDGQAVVSVRDTGIGIPAEELGRVFDMFAQAHRAVGRGQGGLGIGLTMVRSLVEMHGGTVEAKSGGSGLGSEFLVRLPLAARADETGERPGLAQPRPDTPFAGQRILVVDDNRDAADTLGLLLEAEGAEVRVAYDGRAALALADSFDPHSVLLDIGMPGMDGYEVAYRLRQEPRFAGLRIVALTGWGKDADRRQTRNRGFNHHLTKPVSLEELQQALA